MKFTGLILFALLFTNLSWAQLPIHPFLPGLPDLPGLPGGAAQPNPHPTWPHPNPNPNPNPNPGWPMPHPHPNPGTPSAPAAKLGSYQIDPTRITVSGVSSGAFMAIQLDVAYSTLFSGAGSIAGGIYWCAEGSSSKAQSTCMHAAESIDVSRAQNEVQRQVAAGQVDDPANLAHHRLYVYNSPKDQVVSPKNGAKLIEFYSKYLSPNQIVKQDQISSGHGWPTVDFGGPCGIGMLPWLLKCNFDLAGEILHTLDPQVQAPKAQMNAKNLILFSQGEFINEQTVMYDTGWVYVPDSCAKGETCGLHLALHGCQMNPADVQDQFAVHSGLNEWAENNHLIVLYPQSAKLNQANPYDCWDWFGFTGADYANKKGPQMQALVKMIQRLKGAGNPNQP